MEQTQCPQGHFYSPAYPGDASCPHCSKVNLDLMKTVPAYDHTVPVENHQKAAAPRGSAGGKTVGVYQFEDSKILPVVGWLVCEKGPERGKDYRIVPGRNFIGRGENMPIRIAGDDAISRDNHAVVSYNPRKRGFTLANGDSSGLTYVNGDEVITAVELKAFDRIELGKSTFAFLPFCGPDFGWQDAE